MPAFPLPFLSLLTITYSPRTIMDILFKLPVEILNLVTDLLDCKSLACLRLVGKEAQHVATPTFGRKHLHTLRPTFLPVCLDALIEISENKLLRGHVKKILFATWKPEQNVEEWKLRSYDPEERERFRAVHKYCIEQQQPLIEPGQHTKLIAKALTSFKDAGVPLILGIFDNKYGNGKLFPIVKGWSADPLYDELFDFELWTRGRGNVLDSVVKAANLCNYPLEAIGLTYSRPRMIPGLWGFQKRSRSKKSFPTSCPTLVVQK